MPPVTFYADMANWIDLAEGRVDPGPVEDAIAHARIVPVLSLPHMLELTANGRRGGQGTSCELYGISCGDELNQMDSALSRCDSA